MDIRALLNDEGDSEELAETRSVQDESAPTEPSMRPRIRSDPTRPIFNTLTNSPGITKHRSGPIQRPRAISQPSDYSQAGFITYPSSYGDSSSPVSVNSENDDGRRSWKWIEHSDKSKSRRMPSGYMMYSNKLRESVRRQNPHLTHRQITSRLGEMWRQLQPSERDIYHEQARVIRESLPNQASPSCADMQDHDDCDAEDD
eukprot:TRINITY_DN11267_c0_g1_i1.p1 TRINITY_DN11267_c0_g1~~TRINITY_DN11267_c0_g1_i1.p1  ORF type:complete len:201 (-),score=34.15 TRINITY_DN11267_c0_g1_i1:209-811(-)